MRRLWMHIAVVAIIALALVALAGCGDDNKDSTTPTGPPQATAAATAAETPAVTASAGTPGETFEGGGRAPVEGTLGEQATPPPLATLVDVRAAEHNGFDRIVFEFQDNAPDFRVEYVPQAILCGSGQPVTVTGAAVLQVRFTAAAAHNDQATPTVNTFELTPNLPAILRALQTCDFEGEVTWQVGLTAESDFKVTKLEDAARLVVDIAHP